jgi:hypothetical protein
MIRGEVGTAANMFCAKRRRRRRRRGEGGDGSKGMRLGTWGRFGVAFTLP